MKISVDKLYRYSSSNNVALLGSSNNSDFWSVYKSNYTVYDRYFRDHFLSWLYWLEFEDNITIAEIYNDFITAVNSHLAINNKRYSELYRVQVLAADAYDIVNNYDLSETHTTTRSDSATDIQGQRSDSTSTSTTSGAREDSTSTTTVDGARSDSGSTTVGAAVNTSEKEFAGFNSSGYNDADKTTDNIGTHTDTTSVSKGEQTNTNNTTLNKGSQSDSTTGNATKGSQTDTHSGNSSESISISRKGNIGVQTAADVIGGHISLWTAFNFYKMIFDEIAKEYLMIG